MKIAFVNSCIREKDSRTLVIAKEILNTVKYRPDVEIEEFDLNKLPLVPYNFVSLNEMMAKGVNPLYFDISKRIASSDILFIAAPFWDMGIPGLLKTFLEKLSIPDVMFVDDGKTCRGIAHFKHVVYVCTRGMDIEDGSPLEQASPYLKALQYLWTDNNDGFHMVSAYNLDYVSEEEIMKKINAAIRTGIDLMKEII